MYQKLWNTYHCMHDARNPTASLHGGCGFQFSDRKLRPERQRTWPEVTWGSGCYSKQFFQRPHGETLLRAAPSRPADRALNLGTCELFLLSFFKSLPELWNGIVSVKISVFKNPDQ